MCVFFVCIYVCSMSGFSAAVKLGDLDDFLSPANECIVPLVPQPSKVGIIKSVSGKDGAVAGISLSDCLACSGCVTSAETILLQSQSVDELMEKWSDFSIVFTISSASRRALSDHFGVSQLELCGWLQKRLQVPVLDISLAEAIVLSESLADQQVGPVLTSHCPGWTCYAVKMLGKEILSRLSRVKSAEQIQGMIIKNVCQQPHRRMFSHIPVYNTKPIFHVLVSPCFDKKLEIIRPEYAGMVDLVLATMEFVDLLAGKTPVDVPSKFDIYSLIGLRTIWVPSSSGVESGGYAQAAADQEHINSEWTGRSSDLTQRGNQFMRSNGFKNIQNITRRIRSGTLKNYTLVEVMACPGGCPRGGGQPSGTKNATNTFHETCSPNKYVPALQMRKKLEAVMPPGWLYTEWKALVPIDPATGNKLPTASDLKW